MRKAFKRRLQRSKEKLLAYFLGWKVRRIISLLEAKIKDYVKADLNLEKRQKLKTDFHRYYQKIATEKLYIKKYYEVRKKEKLG